MREEGKNERKNVMEIKLYMNRLKQIIKYELRLIWLGLIVPKLLKSNYRQVRTFAARNSLKSIGNKTTIMQNVYFMEPQNITIGSHSVINANVVLDGRIGIRIGDNVDIARDVHIWSLEHNPNSNTHNTRGAITIIDDYVWIASRASILPGVHIGRGAVVACGSIVTNDVEPMSIVAGIPAKEIGHRNNNLDYEINWFPKFTQY